MTPTEATNRITECVRQRVPPRWWLEHGGFFVGLVAETIAELMKVKVTERISEHPGVADDDVLDSLHDEIGRLKDES